MCAYLTLREVLSQTAAANQRLTANGWLASDPEPRGSDVTNGALSCSGSRKIYNAVCVHVYGESASGRARFTKPTVVSWVYTLWYMSISVTVVAKPNGLLVWLPWNHASAVFRVLVVMAGRNWVSYYIYIIVWNTMIIFVEFRTHSHQSSHKVEH